MTQAELLGWVVAVIAVSAYAWWHRRVVAHYKSRTNYYKNHITILENYTRVIESNHRRLLDHVTHGTMMSQLDKLRVSATSSSSLTSSRYDREVLP